MTNFKKIKKELYKFGLSEKQASVYLSLVGHGELRIQEIVNLTQIPRSSVYESLKKLYELGIVEELVDTHFKKIRSYPIGTMRHGLDEKLSNIQRLITDLDNLEKAIALTTSTNSSPLTAVRYYKGRSGARQLLWNSLKAKSVIYVYSDWGRSRYVGIKYYENFVSEYREIGLKEKVLINPTSAALESIRRFNYPGSPIARTRVEDIRALDKKSIFIKGDTFIYNNICAQIYLKNIEINGFEIESQNFVQMQRSVFETLWSRAQPISVLL